MKACTFRIRALSILLPLLWTCITFPVVLWNGITVTTDVCDEDIEISGNNLIRGSVQVKAIDQDVFITVNNGDALLEGSNIEAGRLFLCADSERIISFCLDDNLTFQGSSGGDGLLVVISGGGIVEFLLANGKKIAFTSDGIAGGGTHVFITMDENDPSTLSFLRKNLNEDNHVEVTVGSQSSLSFIAETSIAAGTSQETGFLEFDPANTGGTGRMVLRIEDTGAVVLMGHLVNEEKPNILLNDIDLTTAAGDLAQMTVFNGPGDTSASLLIINNNATESELLIDPFSQKG